jgi:hypothetical protein
MVRGPVAVKAGRSGRDAGHRDHRLRGGLFEPAMVDAVIVVIFVTCALP